MIYVVGYIIGCLIRIGRSVLSKTVVFVVIFAILMEGVILTNRKYEVVVDKIVEEVSPPEENKEPQQEEKEQPLIPEKPKVVKLDCKSLVEEAKRASYAKGKKLKGLEDRRIREFSNCNEGNLK